METSGDLERVHADWREVELAFTVVGEDLSTVELALAGPGRVHYCEMELLELVPFGLFVVVAVRKLMLLKNLALEALLDKKINDVFHELESFSLFFKLHVNNTSFLFRAEVAESLKFKNDSFFRVNALSEHLLLDLRFNSSEGFSSFFDGFFVFEREHKKSHVNNLRSKEAFLRNVLVFRFAFFVPLVKDSLDLLSVHGEREEMGEVGLVLDVLVVASSSSTAPASTSSSTVIITASSLVATTGSSSASSSLLSFFLLLDNLEVVITIRISLLLPLGFSFDHWTISRIKY